MSMCFQIGLGEAVSDDDRIACLRYLVEHGLMARVRDFSSDGVVDVTRADGETRVQWLPLDATAALRAVAHDRGNTLPYDDALALEHVADIIVSGYDGEGEEIDDDGECGGLLVGSAARLRMDLLDAIAAREETLHDEHEHGPECQCQAQIETYREMLECLAICKEHDLLLRISE